MKNYQFDYTQYLAQLIPLLKELESIPKISEKQFFQVVKKYPKDGDGVFGKDAIIMSYRALSGTNGLQPFDPSFVQKIQMKPTRTISGVTPVTVLTKPFPCPGKCIFCPNDIRMPKSYLADEPGAQRAERNGFDPYLQTYNRLLAFQNTGHHTDKVELIILGGTWSYYPESYQIWFIKECFRALNDFGTGQDDRKRIEAEYVAMRLRFQAAQVKLGRPENFVPGSDPQQNKAGLESRQLHGTYLDESYNQAVSELYVAPEKVGGYDQYQSARWAELLEQQVVNEKAASRSVGLVIETRPDNISVAEVRRIRRLGCTKTQIGFQSLNDDVLKQNKRGHDVAATRRAVNLLRQAGFKIHAHWMPNLYGSSPELDKQDYKKLFEDPDFKPDELKIYPCSLIESAELMQYYQDGRWSPYTELELLDVLTHCLTHTPPYCRLTRVIRDIPSTDIVVGNKKTNFREMAERQLLEAGEKSRDIRAREIRGQKIDEENLKLEEIHYQTSVSDEVFLQFVVEAGALRPSATPRLAAFLRLSLPTVPNAFSELKDCAIIREVHVYGQSVEIGQRQSGKAQHLGLGTKLIESAKALARQKGFSKLAVISAIGTREYYRQRGFKDEELYQVAVLS